MVSFSLFLMRLYFSKKPGLKWISISDELKVQFMSSYLLFQTLILSTLIAPFNCLKQSDGSFSLWNQSSIKCFEGDWSSMHLVPIILLMLVYVVCPSILVVQSYLKIMKASKSDKQLASLAAADSVINLLTRSFRSEYFWFECVHILKRLLIILTSTVLTANSSASFRYFLVVALLTGFLIVDVAVMPLRNAFANKMSLLWNSIALFVLVCDGFAFRNPLVTQDMKNTTQIGLIVVVVLTFALSSLVFIRSQLLGTDVLTLSVPPSSMTISSDDIKPMLIISQFLYPTESLRIQQAKSIEARLMLEVDSSKVKQ
jgi:hypothetical protein